MVRGKAIENGNIYEKKNIQNEASCRLFSFVFEQEEINTEVFSCNRNSLYVRYLNVLCNGAVNEAGKWISNSILMKE